MAIWALFLRTELTILGLRRTLLLHVGLTLISLRTLSNYGQVITLQHYTLIQ